MILMYDPKWLESEIRCFSEKFGIDAKRTEDSNGSVISYELSKGGRSICNVQVPLSPRIMLVVDYDVANPEYIELRNRLGTYYRGKMVLRYLHNGTKKSDVIDTTKVGFY